MFFLLCYTTIHHCTTYLHRIENAAPVCIAAFTASRPDPSLCPITDIHSHKEPTPAMTKATTKFLSWNVNGLGDKIKRGIVSQYIKRLGPDVVLLQETHMLGNMCKALDRGGYKMIAYSGFTRGSRGVCILAKKSLPLTVNRKWSDPRGKFFNSHRHS